MKDIYQKENGDWDLCRFVEKTDCMVQTIKRSVKCWYGDNFEDLEYGIKYQQYIGLYNFDGQNMQKDKEMLIGEIKSNLSGLSFVKSIEKIDVNYETKSKQINVSFDIRLKDDTNQSGKVDVDVNSSIV